jgi:hypothetical protein
VRFDKKRLHMKNCNTRRGHCQSVRVVSCQLSVTAGSSVVGCRLTHSTDN